MDWLNGLSDSQKSFVTEGKFENVGALVDAFSKSKSAGWSDGLPDLDKGFLDSKGFKSPSDIIKSYQSLESLKGVPENRLLKLPEKGIEDDPKSWEAVYARLGRPETADSYDVSKLLNEKSTEEDKKQVAWLKDVFHQLGFNKKQAATFIDKWVELAGQQEKAMKESHAASIAEADTALKQAWGINFEKNKQVALKAAKEFGVDEVTLANLAQAMGESKAYDLLFKIGSQVGESSFIDGGGGDKGAQTRQQALHEINRLQQDTEWCKRWVSGDQECVSQMEKLTKLAFTEAA